MLSEGCPQRGVVALLLARSGALREVEASLAHNLVAEVVEREDVDFGNVREPSTKMLGQERVEAENEDPEPLRHQPPRLLRGKERLSRAGAARDRHAGLPREKVEDAVLLFGQPEQLALLLDEFESERRAEIERVRKDVLDVVKAIPEWRFLVFSPPVGEDPVKPFLQGPEIRPVEQNLARCVRPEPGGIGTGVREGDAVADVEAIVVDSLRSLEELPEREGRSPRLVERVLDLEGAFATRARPRALGSFVSDRSALHLDDQETVLPVRHDEVCFALARAALPSRRQPRDVVKGDEVVRDVILEVFEQPDLGRALDAVARRVGDHSGHRLPT